MEGTESGVPSEPSEPSQRGSVSSAGIRALEVLVYLVNDTAVQLTVESLPSVSAQDLGRTVREALQLPETAQDAFAFWLSSPLLELQLKPKHQPYKVCRQWPDLLYRFTEAPEEEIAQDEPCLQYRRNVFFPKAKELQLQDEAVLRLLYEEARCHVLAGRYPCDPPEWQRLGGLVCRLELGPPQDGPAAAASPLREKKLSSFLPAHVCRGGGLLGALRGRGARHGLEQGLLEEYRRASSEDGARGPGDTALLREYLRVCHTLPYYGCAFFSGEIDKPAQGILQRSGRKTVSVAVSLEGVYVMDPKEKFVLLGLHFRELSWDHTYPEEEGDSHVLWLEFDGEEAGTPVNRLLKIYSKQAELMSGLIEYCVELGVAGGGAPEGGGDGAPPSQQPLAAAAAQAGDGRRGKLRRQSSVVSSRVQRLHTISYVDDGKEIKRLKPRRATSFFTRQAPASQPSYSAVQAAESLEQG